MVYMLKIGIPGREQPCPFRKRLSVYWSAQVSGLRAPRGSGSCECVRTELWALSGIVNQLMVLLLVGRRNRSLVPSSRVMSVVGAVKSRRPCR